jgi:hypothetical protein
MKRAFAFAAPLALGLAGPALATGGFQCRPVTGTGPVLTMAVGHTLSPIPISVTLQEGSRTLSTYGPRAPIVVGQSWMDQRHLWLDLVDANLNRYEAKLRATFQPRLRGRPAVGTFVRNGRTFRVRCEEA